jgi:hypothetical protein
MVLGATMWKGSLVVALLGVQPLLAILFLKKVFHSHITVWEIVSKKSCFLRKIGLICVLSKSNAIIHAIVVRSGRLKA